MTDLPHIELLRALARHNVPFVVVGGQAVIFHGHMRTTEDVDVIWLRSPEAERALLAALAEVRATWISNEVDHATGLEKLIPVDMGFIQATHLMMLVTEHGFLDVFDYVPGFPNVDPREVFDEGILAGDIRYASLRWLKEMKRAAGRPRDVDDLQNLS